MSNLNKANRLINENLLSKNPVLILENCNLTGNEFFLEKLKKSYYLDIIDLHKNQIENIEFLSPLRQLKWIDLSHNQLSDISGLKKLINAETLFLYSNQISDISVLKKLRLLQNLTLMNNKISSISLEFLNQLPRLKELYLNNNPINNIPKEIFDKQENVLREVTEYLRSTEKRNQLLYLINETEYSTFFNEVTMFGKRNPQLARLEKRFIHDGGGYEFPEQLKVWVLHNFQ